MSDSARVTDILTHLKEIQLSLAEIKKWAEKLLEEEKDDSRS